MIITYLLNQSPLWKVPKNIFKDSGTPVTEKFFPPFQNLSVTGVHESFPLFCANCCQMVEYLSEPFLSDLLGGGCTDPKSCIGWLLLPHQPEGFQFHYQPEGRLLKTNSKAHSLWNTPFEFQSYYSMWSLVHEQYVIHGLWYLCIYQITGHLLNIFFTTLPIPYAS